MRDLIALLERYVPGCSNQIQGASTAEIDFLEDAFGQPLPDVYRFFAIEMGRDGGPLLAHVRSYNPFDIADKYKTTSNDIPPQRFLFIFGDPNPLTRFHYWLDLEAPSEDGDFQVVQFPSSDCPTLGTACCSNGTMPPLDSTASPTARTSDARRHAQSRQAQAFPDGHRGQYRPHEVQLETLGAVPDLVIEIDPASQSSGASGLGPEWCGA